MTSPFGPIVIIAMNPRQYSRSRPTMFSSVATTCAGNDCGAKTPYPIVPSVSALKKNASEYEPGRAFAMPPVQV